jgi:hypothetical protein
VLVLLVLVLVLVLVLLVLLLVLVLLVLLVLVLVLVLVLALLLQLLLPLLPLLLPPRQCTQHPGAELDLTGCSAGWSRPRAGNRTGCCCCCSTRLDQPQPPNTHPAPGVAALATV